MWNEAEVQEAEESGEGKNSVSILSLVVGPPSNSLKTQWQPDYDSTLIDCDMFDMYSRVHLNSQGTETGCCLRKVARWATCSISFEYFLAVSSHSSPSSSYYFSFCYPFSFSFLFVFFSF